MIEINFKYREKNNIIKCNKEDLIKQVCINFAEQTDLDIENIFFIYEGRKLNLELNFTINEQFRLDDKKNKKKKRIDLEVCEEFPFKIKFLYNEENIPPFNVNEDENMEDILKKFASRIKKDREKLLFLHNGGPLLELGDKKVKDVMNKNDKKEKVMSIDVALNDFDEESINNDNDKVKEQEDKIVNIAGIEDGMIQNFVQTSVRQGYYEPLSKEKKSFFIKNFMILGIQHASIILLSFFGFFFKINELLTKADFSPLAKFLPLFFVVLILSFVFDIFLKEYKNTKYMIILYIFYPICIIYYSFIISEYLDYKYIIIGLSLIGLEILSLGIHAIAFGRFKIYFFTLSSSVLSLIGLILFSVLWIKDLLPIIYVSIFWLATIGLYTLWVFASLKLCQLYEYFYSPIIFNYGIFIGLAHVIDLGIKAFYNLLKKKFYDFDFEESQIKIFAILLGQYTIITIIVWIGFSLGWNKVMEENNTTMGWLIAVDSIISFILSTVFICNRDDPSSKKEWYIFHVVFVPIMIIYFFAFSNPIESKYILGFIFIIFFDLLFIVLGIFIFESEKITSIIYYCLISNLLTIIPFHFFWLKNATALLVISILTILVDIYLIVLKYITKKIYEEYISFSVLTFDYGLFAGATFIVFLICGGLSKCCEACEKC